MHQRMRNNKSAGWLELHNGKLLRAVLRGRGRRKVPELPGATSGFLRNIIDAPFLPLTYFYLWFYRGCHCGRASEHLAV